MISTLTDITHTHSLRKPNVNQLRIDALYNQYRTFAMGLVDVTDPELFYKVQYNATDSYNEEGMHEQYVRRGSSVLDLSVGVLDYPWLAADVTNSNETTIERLMELATIQHSMLVAYRIRSIAQFVSTLPMHTRVYYYSNTSGGVVITVSDELNGIKFSHMLNSYDL